MALKQLTIYGVEGKESSITESVSDTQPCSITKSVSEHQPKALLRFLNRALTNGKGGVGIYQPGKRQAQYFRFSYRDGTRTKHRHIPGGNIYSPLALERAKKIQDMADRKVSIVDILDTISNFS